MQSLAGLKVGSYLCAGKEIRISLDPGDDLTQDDAVGEHVRLQTDEQMHFIHALHWLQQANRSEID